MASSSGTINEVLSDAFLTINNKNLALKNMLYLGYTNDKIYIVN